MATDARGVGDDSDGELIAFEDDFDADADGDADANADAVADADSSSHATRTAAAAQLQPQAKPQPGKQSQRMLAVGSANPYNTAAAGTIAGAVNTSASASASAVSVDASDIPEKSFADLGLASHVHTKLHMMCTFLRVPVIHCLWVSVCRLLPAHLLSMPRLVCCVVLLVAVWYGD